MGGSVSSVGDDADHANAGAGTGRRVEPSTEAVREQLERILASADFVASDRLKRSLRFIVEEALAGRADRLKAYTIALEVFGRDPSFDPQNDPVVRMEAGRLRRRLERYFLGTGRSDPVRIEIPKGDYAPIFTCRAMRYPPAHRRRPSLPGAACSPFARRLACVWAVSRSPVWFFSPRSGFASKPDGRSRGEAARRPGAGPRDHRPALREPLRHRQRRRVRQRADRGADLQPDALR